MQATLLQSVESTMIKAVGYNDEAHILEIVFKSSPTTVYQYAGFSPEAYGEFIASKSLGGHFYKNIRNVYGDDFQKMEVETPLDCMLAEDHVSSAE